MSVSSLSTAVMRVALQKVSVLSTGVKVSVGAGGCSSALCGKRPGAAPCWTQLIPTDTQWSRYSHCSPCQSRWIFLKKLWSTNCPHQSRGKTWRGRSCCEKLTTTSHPPEPRGGRVGELAVKSSLGQQRGKVLFQCTSFFVSRYPHLF